MTLAALEKQLAILRLGSDEYERQQQLATATTHEELEKIEALQAQISAREAAAEAERQAGQDAEKRAAQLANAQTGITATEGRLITRGNAGSEQKQMLKTQQDSLVQLQQIREHLSQSSKESVELVIVGGSA
jgi:hypothetical protein